MASTLCMNGDGPLTELPLEIQGTIKFTNDTDYWQANSFPFVFQNVTTFFKLGGDDVFIYGGMYSLLGVPRPEACRSV